MAHYVILGSFTDQGIRAVKDTARRAKAFRDTAKAAGVTVKDIYWTLGHVDLVIALEASNDETVASLVMKLGSLGNVRSQTLRAFSEKEIEGLVSKV